MFVVSSKLPGFVVLVFVVTVLEAVSNTHLHERKLETISKSAYGPGE